MRLAQINKPVKDMTYEEIKKIKLCDTNTYIPKLVDVLDFIDGRVPVLIEIKYDNKVGSLEKKLVSILEKYSGKYALQSFNPFTIKWLRDNAPHIIRGQLASDFKSEKMSLIKKFLLKNMVFNFLGQPDFISYKVEDLDRKKAKKIREKRILLGWTVRDRKEYEKLSQYYDNLICEDFI